jgi:3-oxoacyl-[acyl-carrier protein] reductase
MNLGLQDKVAIVLASSKGLGRASAEALAAEGVWVTIGSRNRELLEQTALDIRDKTGSKVLAVPTDVTKPDDLEVIVEATLREFGRVDILINNAGGPPPGTFEHFGDAQWEAAFQLNLLSNVRMVRLVLPHMRKQGKGRIINIVSTSVKQPIDGLLLSNAIRTGVVGLAKTLSIELAPDNITVNNVCPGRILTDRIRQTTRMHERIQQGMTEEEVLRESSRDIPMGRIGKPEELAALVAFLASDQAGYITEPPSRSMVD